MEDLKIIELFFERKECAVAETERKYGRYLSKIAYNILFDSEDSEENIGKEFFNLIIRNECKSSEGLGFDVDMVEETIEINVSETETKYLFNFWNSAPMPKDMVEWLINGITR